MSVPIQDTDFPYTANGSTDTFAYQCYILDESHLKVYLDEVEQTFGYTVTGVGVLNGGTVVFDTDPVADTLVRLRRQVPLERLTDYQQLGDLRSDTLDDDLDKVWMVLQDRQRDLEKSIRYPAAEELDGTLPPAGSRANHVLGFDDLGQQTMLPITTVGAGQRITDTFATGAGFTPDVTTQLILSVAPAVEENLDVFFDAAFQGPDQYTISGTTLTFSSPIPSGVQKVFVRIGTTVSITTPPNFSVTDPKVATLSKLFRRISDIGYVTDPAYGADGNGITDNLAAFTAAAADTTPGKTKTYIVPDGTYFLSAAVPAGPGRVDWQFSPGATLTGPGSLPYHKATMNYNASPNYGARRSLWHGTDANPATDGVVATDYIQRVDQSVTADDPGHLISALYVTHKRLTGGTGWLYGGYFYLEDQSNSTQAQSVAVAGAAHGTISGAVWGVYGEANSHSQFSTIQGGEFDCFNNSGVDYAFDHLDPFGQPFSMGVWSISFGGNKNSIGMGVGASNAPQTTDSSWHVGFYMAPWSCVEYGFDIQAQPKTLINFENGASTDGTGVTPGGIGLDCGFGAAYGTGANQCAIHLRSHRLGFGNFGFMQYNPGINALEFWSSISTRSCRLDLATGTLIPG